MLPFDPFVACIVVLCGLVIGALSGMFGIGGGTIIVPLLNLAFGLPMISATSTSLFTILPTALSGAYKHIRQKTVHLKVGLTTGVAGAVFSVVGALLSEKLPELFLVILTVMVLIYSSVTMLLNASRKPVAAEVPDKKQTEALEEQSDNSESRQPKMRDESHMNIPLVLGLGCIAGLMAGLIGIGGGFIVVPFCVAYLGFTMKEAAGTSLVAVSIIAIPGIITHALLGQIEWFYGVALIVGTIPGAQLGAWLVAKLPDRPMRAAFGILLLITGGLLLVKNLVS
ncbi:MAG: sulfite exporter TauE/SafE family protein [Coriobacteriia bacterium]|nr:sulfite exporter TauE/SafE family protein [Coriobacteriia bacterium]